MYNAAEAEGIYGYQGESEKLGPELHIEVRHGFIKKVFSIVGIQLALTSLIAFPFVYYAPAAAAFMQDGGSIMILVVMAVTMGLMCYMSCNPQVARTYPQNYIFLAAITVGMGCMVGVSCMQYQTTSILVAAGMTGVITGSLVAFASQTKYDFTGFGPYLFVALIGLTLFGFVLMFIPGETAHKIYAGCGAILFSFYIVYDTQLIVGGKNRKHEFSIDDYVFAALNLYLDIINLFLKLLELLGERR